MYVTARATPARRGIAHNAKQKTLFEKAWQNSRLIRLGQEFFVLYLRFAPARFIIVPSLRSGSPQASSDNWLHLLFFYEKKSKTKKTDCRGTPLPCLD